VSRTQAIHTFRPVSDRAEAHLELNAFRRKGDAALVITGESLEVSHASLSLHFSTRSLYIHIMANGDMMSDFPIV